MESLEKSMKSLRLEGILWAQLVEHLEKTCIVNAPDSSFELQVQAPSVALCCCALPLGAARWRIRDGAERHCWLSIPRSSSPPGICRDVESSFYFYCTLHCLIAPYPSTLISGSVLSIIFRDIPSAFREVFIILSI